MKTIISWPATKKFIGGLVAFLTVIGFFALNEVDGVLGLVLAIAAWYIAHRVIAKTISTV